MAGMGSRGQGQRAMHASTWLLTNARAGAHLQGGVAVCKQPTQAPAGRQRGRADGVRHACDGHGREGHAGELGDGDPGRQRETAVRQSVAELVPSISVSFCSGYV